MEKFIKLTGVAAPLPMINIDTDMIIPKQFLKTILRTGLGKNLFDEMRYDDDGNEIADFLGFKINGNGRVLTALRIIHQLIDVRLRQLDRQNAVLDGRKIAGVKRRLETLVDEPRMLDAIKRADDTRINRLYEAEGYFRSLADHLRS